MHSLSISKSQRSILKKDNLDLSERKTPNKVSFADQTRILQREKENSEAKAAKFCDDLN